MRHEPGITFEVPDMPDIDVALEPDRRPVKGVAQRDIGRLEGWIRIGQPWCTALTAKVAGDDADLKRYVAGGAAQSRFAVVSLSCTFAPQGDAEFVKAWVQVHLARDDGQTSPAPIAYSMQPVRGGSPRQLTRTVKVGADLKLLQTGVEEGVIDNIENLFVEALYEGESNPAWELSRTSAASISGVQRFSMVVLQPKVAVSSGIVTVTATVENKRFGIFTYNGKPPDPAKLTFRVP